MWIFELSLYVGGGEKMLKEPMEAFEQMLQKKGDRLITDVHIPKEGTYRIIEMSDSEWKVRTTVDISFDKKTGQIVGQNCSDYRLIQELDYLSKLLEMNKPIDPKKVIHSNNYLSLAVKKESIISGNIYSLLEKISDRLVSKPTNGFTIADDDDDINLNFEFIKTGTPNVYKLKDIKTGKFLESLFGTLRLNSEKKDDTQCWMFNLQEDGYYQIQNVKDKKYITVSGSNTFNGTNLYLTEYSKKLMQDFAVYFDSSKYKYKEADLFSTTYRANNLKLMGAK